MRPRDPVGGKRNVKTLASTSGVTRFARYTTYLHLKEWLEHWRDQLREGGAIADPRDAQIDRLKEQVCLLREPLAISE